MNASEVVGSCLCLSNIYSSFVPLADPPLADPVCVGWHTPDSRKDSANGSICSLGHSNWLADGYLTQLRQGVIVLGHLVLSLG